MGQCRTLDADSTIWCYQGDYSQWDNVELWMLIQPFGVIKEIIVHGTM